MADDYQFAKLGTKAAYSEYNYASESLQNAKIYERLAEIKSQHEPLNSLIGEYAAIGTPAYKEAREKLYAVAFYVVIGRMP